MRWVRSLTFKYHYERRPRLLLHRFLLDLDAFAILVLVVQRQYLRTVQSQHADKLVVHCDALEKQLGQLRPAAGKQKEGREGVYQQRIVEQEEQVRSQRLQEVAGDGFCSSLAWYDVELDFSTQMKHQTSLLRSKRR